MAGLAAVGAVLSLQDSGFAAVIAISLAISSAFFGAMCMAAETIILTLARLLDHFRHFSSDRETSDNVVRILNNVRLLAEWQEPKDVK